MYVLEVFTHVLRVSVLFPYQVQSARDDAHDSRRDGAGMAPLAYVLAACRRAAGAAARQAPAQPGERTPYCYG
eukprot:COSAG05_NODE_9835_length_598_cov_1.122244_1_plen_73_part_00